MARTRPDGDALALHDPITVIIADDHRSFGEALQIALDKERDLSVVGVVDRGDDAVRVTIHDQPDVVLMDLRMPGTDGVTATGQIAATGDARVLVVTTYDTDADILRAVEAGATGYLLKDTPRRELAEAVRAAARGETVLAPPVARKLVSRVRLPAVESPTPRELEVLAQVAKGLSNVDIGRELHISEATVKTHLVRIFEKLGVSDRTAAVTKAIGQGLLPPP